MLWCPGPTLESKAMRAIFQKKSKKRPKKSLKRAKKDETLQNLGKNYLHAINC